MHRDKGLRRTTAITGVLVAASLAGTFAVGLAARAADATDTAATTADSSTDGSAATDSGSTSTDSPSITSDDSDSGQATSGGS
jgi:hypothetical protein